MLLDTYAWIEFFIGSEKGNVVNKILKNNICYTSAISIAEISEWVERGNYDRKKIFSDVESFSTIIDLDGSILESAGIIKVKKRQKIKDFGMVDAIILATAKQHDMQIVTGDRHFKDENIVAL